MTIKQMAALRVALFVGTAVTLSVLNTLAIEYFGLATVGMVWAVALFAYGIKFVYDVELAKLESQNSLKKLKELG